MKRTHHGQHGEDCFGCKCQSLRFTPTATPTERKGGAPKGSSNSWERGIPTDSRGMPVLKADGTPMGQKEYAANRSQIDEHKRRLANSTEPVLPPGAKE